MKINPQIIVQNGSPIFVVLPYQEFEFMTHSLEDIQDMEIVRASEKDNSERFPLELIERIASGKNPIATFRTHRQWSQAELAKKVGVSRQYISQIEGRTRQGTPRLLKKIAQTLNIDLDDLI